MRSSRLAVSVALLVSSAATAGSLAAPADAAVPTTPYSVTLQSSTKHATAKEDPVVLTGLVTPKPPEGSTVVVQAKYENSNAWRKVGTAVIKPNGKYRFVDHPSTHLDRLYRVVKKADEKALAKKSRTREVTVDAWNWIVQMATSAGANTLKASSLPINGDTYGHVLYADRSSDTAFAEYTLGRKCTTFETTFGLSDRTETGGQASIAVVADSVAKYFRTFDLGVSDPQSLDVTGVYRMRIDFAQITTTPDTEPALGAARVLCD
jgi:hypothetical protein